MLSDLLYDDTFKYQMHFINLTEIEDLYKKVEALDKIPSSTTIIDFLLENQLITLSDMVAIELKIESSEG